MSDDDPQFQQIFEQAFTRLVETERRLAAKTTDLENTQAALATIHTKLGSLLGPFETSQHGDVVRSMSDIGL